jgi:predicted metal-dependent peptidase
MMNEETIDVSVCIDMSGSISDEMAKDFLSEVKGIMDEYTDFKLDLWTFDTEVYGYKQFTGDTADEIMEYECKGGGGTDFTPAFKWLDTNHIVPDALIYLTDGYGTFPQHAPNYPVLWGNVTKSMPDSHYPFGEVVTVPVTQAA